MFELRVALTCTFNRLQRAQFPKVGQCHDAAEMPTCHFGLWYYGAGWNSLASFERAILLFADEGAIICLAQPAGGQPEGDRRWCRAGVGEALPHNSGRCKQAAVRVPNTDVSGSLPESRGALRSVRA